MTKISELTAATSIDKDFFLAGVTDPSGSPETQRVNQRRINAYNGVLNVLDFGADNTGAAVDNATAFNNALAELSVTIGGVIVVPPGTYNFDTAVDLGEFRQTAVVQFNMTGAILQTDDAISIFQRHVADQTEALQWIDAQFMFVGGVFQGDSTSGQKGLDLEATYQSMCIGTRFRSFDTGAHVKFCLGMEFFKCRGQNNVTQDFLIDTGTGHWTGASRSNSQSNHTVMRACRIFGAAASTANIHVKSCSGVQILECITEGSNPVDSIVFDAEDATVVKDFTVVGLHNENTPTNAIIRCDSQGGIMVIDRVFTQTATTFLDVTGSAASIFKISNIPNQGSLTKIVKGAPNNGSHFHFENVLRNQNLHDATFWDTAYPTSDEVYQFDGRDLTAPVLSLGVSNPGDFSNPQINARQDIWYGTDDTYSLGRSRTQNRPNKIHVGTGESTFDGQTKIRVKNVAATGLADAANNINTQSKFAGTLALDVTNNILYVATGSATTDTWKSTEDGTTVTPS